MNDITALAQQLRATAEKANEHGEFNMAMHTVEVLVLVEALEKAQTERDELRQGFIANQEEAREAIKYAYELKEQLDRACAGLDEAFREVDEMQKSLDHTHRRRAIWRGRAEEDESKLAAAEKRIAELDARAFNPAILDVVAERQRQQSAEGWAPEHDDQYGKSQLLWASSCYMLNTIQPFNRIPMDWPWDSSWWKPTNPRRDLVKAGALIIAEIERIDRAAAAGKGATS